MNRGFLPGDAKGILGGSGFNPGKPRAGWIIFSLICIIRVIRVPRKMTCGHCGVKFVVQFSCPNEVRAKFE